jgi:phosphoribosyl 1,2-cyclic phosphodiesterase
MHWSPQILWQSGQNKLLLVAGNGLPVFYIDTGKKFLQIGSAPAVYKNTINMFNRVADAFVVPPPRFSLAGDNWTGFEFPLWRARFYDFLNPQQVALWGHSDHVESVYQRLGFAMFGDYVADYSGAKQAHWVARRWLDDVLQKKVQKSYKSADWRLQIRSDDIVIECEQQRWLWSELFASHAQTNAPVVLAEHAFAKNEFGVFISGSGVGSRPGNTSSFLVKQGKSSIWIDPPAYAIQQSADLGIALEKVNGLVITHVHEDHIEGVSAWAAYLQTQKTKLPLYTDERIYSQLQRVFTPIIGSLEQYFTFSHYRNLEATQHWRFRRNYHTLPTLGMRINYNGKALGISGDTLYDEGLFKQRYGHRELSFSEMLDLSANFFRGCAVILHDTNVNNDPVHAPLDAVETLSRRLPEAKIYAYHLYEDVESERIKKANTGDFYPV